MKKMKLSEKSQKKKKIFFLLMLIIGVLISYHKLDESNIEITNKEFIQLITNHTFKEEPSILNIIAKKTMEIANPIETMNKEYLEHVSVIKEEKEEEKTLPTVYLYNTHQTEEYKPITLAEISVNPTVIMNNYILQDILKRNNIESIVEEESIQEIRKQNNWNYADSYKASRVLLEKRILEYPSLNYFIDIHRDSLGKDKTTTTIYTKSYAKVLSIVGLENPNYQENLIFTEKINQKLQEEYPTLSKGIYQKSGQGVNGVYNQDFHKHTILIEIGGYENTTSEVLNSTLAFSKVFMEVLHDE